MIDSIFYDTGKIARYQANKSYDYASQLEMPDYSWFELVSRWFNRLINSIFSGSFEENVTTPVMITVFVVALAAVLIYLYRSRPELFLRTRKTESLPYMVEEENIHRIDFGKEIAAALGSGDYRLAIRLKYLQTLRFLSDNKLIDWQIHKTPTEYVFELGNRELRPVLRLLTNRFLEVRYGNYAATAGLYDEICDYQAQLRKGGGA